MLRAVSRASQVQEAPALARGYLSALKVDFASDISGSTKAAKADTDILSDWKKTKATTEHTLKLLDAYKSIGEAKNEPYLKFHNPRTFEDFDAPVPNFRTFGLKAGDVPKFFDTVLTNRAHDSVQKKDAWWAARKAEVEAAASQLEKSFPKVPVPIWQLSKPLAVEALNSTTDAYFKSLEPKRKLKLPTIPAQVTDTLASYAKSLGQEGAVASLKDTLLKTLAEKAVVEEGGKAVPGFKYPNPSELAKVLKAKREEVNKRWVALWSKRLAVNPESALVPLKEIDHLIASNYEDFSPKYNSLVFSASKGSEAYGDKLAAVAGTDSFLLRKNRDKIKEAFPTTEEEQEAIRVAKELGDQQAALEKLLGPTLLPEGSRLRSQEVEDITNHLFQAGRYFHTEGLKLADKLRDEEAALKEELQAVYGEDVDVARFQKDPRTAVQLLHDRLKEIESSKADTAADLAAAGGNPYLEYITTKQSAFLSDPSNMALEEVLYPELVAELHAIEIAELDDQIAKIAEAEEEEAFHLRLLEQSRHIHQNIDFDLPQGAVAHMDPVLVKKIDFETTHTLDTLHKEVFEGADSENGQYVKDQWGVEALSHHFLPLLRYRRKKYRQKYGYYQAERMAPPSGKPNAPAW